VRIVHVTNAGGSGRVQRGGAERAVQELSSGFAADPEWRVGVVAPPAFLDGARLHPRVARWPVPLPELSPGRALLPSGQLARVLRRLEPDVVIAHLLRGTLVGLPAARLWTRAATVSILHNSLHDAAPPPGERRPRDRANLLAFRLVGRLATAHVAISESNARDLVAKDHQRPERVHLIHNWVSAAFTDSGPVDRAGVRAGLGLDTVAPLVVVAGRLERQKRQDLVIGLLPELPGVTLALLGEGSLHAAYARLADAAGVRDRVRFLGFREDVAAVLAAADVVAVPSAFEGFGRVAVEALAVGTPVVASRVDGLLDALRGAPDAGVTLVDRDDRRAWQRALADRTADPLPDADRRALRAWAAARHGFEDRLAAYRKLVQFVAQERTGRRRRARPALR
jgi:glycosyltransferase involved in cell wall biosynthesis